MKMSGELIGELRGKIIGTRIVELLETSPNIETTDQSTGKLLDIDAQDMSTAWSMWRSPDSFYAEGLGVTTSNSGEMATYTGSGVGKGGPGSSESSFHGMLLFRSSTPKWARLNGVAVMVEYTVDADGNTHTRLWEWKGRP
jgi:hypothetical protein